MVELPVSVLVVLGIFATIGFSALLDILYPSRFQSRLILDMSAVNNKDHLLMVALTSQAHRDGDPEF